MCTMKLWGWDGVVGIATCYGLDGPGIDPGGARFSAPVQTCTGAHLALCTMGNRSRSQELSGRDMALTIHTHLEQRLRKEYRAISLLPTWAFVVCSRLNFAFYFTVKLYFCTHRFYIFVTFCIFVWF